MLKSLFRSKPITAFAKELANDISRRYPPRLDQQGGKRPSVNRLTKILNDAMGRAEEFQAEYRLGWLGKARLGNAFRWELQEMGYSKELVDLATEALIVYISRPQEKPGRS